MAINYINTGSSANKGDGDTLRTAFNKINANFETLVQEIGSTSSFVLPTASTSTLGGIKVGANLTISNGVLSATASPTAEFSGTVAVLTATNYIDLNGIILSNNSGTLSAITITGTIAPDYVELLLHGENFLDDSNYDVAILDNGVTISTSTIKYGAGSFYFDGSSYISLPGSASNPAFDQTGDITIEFWSYVSEFNVGTIIASESISGQHWSIQNAGGRFYFQCNDGTNDFEIIPTSFFITNQWTHCAVVKAGSIVSLYQGGTLIGNVNIGSSTAFNNTIYDISIGSITDGTQGFFQGYLDEIRISRGIALYTGTFAPPAAAFPGDTFLIASALPPSGSNFTVTNISYFTNDANYLTSSTVNQYVSTGTNFTVTNISYFNNDSGYVTATYVTSLGYTTTATVRTLIANSLTNYATQTYVTSRGYLTATDIQSYGYLTAESDTLNSVLARGSSTVQTITAGHIVPAGNKMFDLGTSSTQWRSLYVGTATIYIDNIALSINKEDNTVVVGPQQGRTVLASQDFVNIAISGIPAGPKGDQGEQGNTGTQGIQGPIGPQGIQGSTGTQGIQGPIGNTGTQGIQGPIGNTGAQGISIVLVGSSATTTVESLGAGAAGQGWINTTDGDIYFWNTLTTLWENIGPIVGPEGPRGLQGVQGEKGDQGLPGAKGDTGAQGPKGDTGDQGSAGAKGDQGIQGNTGTQGLIGPTGPKGDKGDRAEEDRLVNGIHSVILGVDGILTLPGGTSKITTTGESGESVDLVAGPGGWSELASNNGDNFVWVDDAGAYVVTNGTGSFKQWTFGTDGTLTIPSSISSNSTFGVESLIDGYNSGVYFDGDRTGSGNAILYAVKDAIIRADNNGLLIPGIPRDWLFGADGKLTLPAGGVISGYVAPPVTITLTNADWSDANHPYERDFSIVATPTWTASETDTFVIYNATNYQWEVHNPAFGTDPIYLNGGSLTFPSREWTVGPTLGSIAPIGAYSYANEYNFESSTLTVPGTINSIAGNDLNLKAFNSVGGGVTISLQNRNLDTGGRNTQLDVKPDNITLTTDFDNNQYEWILGADGTLTLPGSSNELYTTTNALIKSISDIQISAGDDVGSNWTFRGDGKLQLPLDGDILDSNGSSVLGGGGGGFSLPPNTTLSDFYSDGGATLFNNSGTLALYSNVADGNDGVEIRVKGDDGDGTWQFKSNGVLTLAGVPKPNFFYDHGTIQYQPSGWLAVQTVGPTIHDLPNAIPGAWKFNKTLYDFDFAMVKPGDTLMLDNSYVGYPDPPGTAGYPATITISYQDPDNADLWIIGQNQAGPELPDGTTMWLKYSDERIVLNDTWGFGVDGVNLPYNAKFKYWNKEWTFGVDGSLVFPDNSLLIGVNEDNTSVILNADSGKDFSINTFGPELNNWKFGTDGVLHLPVGGDIVDSNGTSVLGGGSGSAFTYGTVDLHNGGVQNAQILQFDDSTFQSVITGPAPALNGNAQRLIIQGQRATSGEGGDVYVWGGDSDIDGGDIKIYAGDADSTESGSGGYVNISAGRGHDQGGSISITAGNSSNGAGGDVTIAAGIGSATVGRILINNNLNEWSFDREGDFRLANHIIARNGRYYQDCADGTTSMRWINAESENNDIELVRVYRDGGSPYDGQQNEENERVQLGYKDIAPDVSVFYIETTKNPAGLFVTDEDDKRWEFQSTGGVKFPDATVQTTAFTFSNSATAPTTGLLWFNPTEARMYVKYNDQWVDASPTVLAPPDTNPTLESVTFNDATVQTTAWTGTVSYNDLTNKPTFVGGGGASTWLTAD